MSASTSAGTSLVTCRLPEGGSDVEVGDALVVLEGDRGDLMAEDVVHPSIEELARPSVGRQAWGGRRRDSDARHASWSSTSALGLGRHRFRRMVPVAV